MISTWETVAQLLTSKKLKSWEKELMEEYVSHINPVKAKDKISGKLYALKKLRMDLDSDGFPVTSIREIKILNELSHPNLIKLKEVVVGYKKDR
jgi:serine/threonine protein kinase